MNPLATISSYHVKELANQSVNEVVKDYYLRDSQSSFINAYICIPLAPLVGLYWYNKYFVNQLINEKDICVVSCSIRKRFWKEEKKKKEETNK